MSSDQHISNDTIRKIHSRLEQLESNNLKASEVREVLLSINQALLGLQAEIDEATINELAILQTLTALVPGFAAKYAEMRPDAKKFINEQMPIDLKKHQKDLDSLK